MLEWTIAAWVSWVAVGAENEDETRDMNSIDPFDNEHAGARW
jgi:hypothetical protein